MQKSIFIVLAFLVSFTTFSQTDLWKKGEAIHPLGDWMRDPYIVIGPDSMYYLTATQYIPESENVKQPIYKSKDLLNWKFEGFFYSVKNASHYENLIALAQKSKNDNVREQGLKLWAPEMHFINGRWIIVHTSNVGLGNLALLPKGKELSQEFSDWGMTFGKNHDPSIFQDDDGKIWLVSKCTTIQQVKPDLSGFKGKRISIGPSDRKMGHEGAYIIKVKGKYVLFGTAWSTDKMRHGTYNLYYCTSDKIQGPYGQRKFAGRFLGHGTPFQDLDGKWWCTAFYNANKPTLSSKEILNLDSSKTAYTINKQGLTLVPLDIFNEDGNIEIVPRDPRYRNPGKEEIQRF